ncbi:MAG: class I SAM-dependent methyltransferase [Actinomycetota bacterium]|nr:class I SAM-dependent methyltransferase [Actinomycetota bacterium]
MAPEQDGKPDVDALVAELRAKVEERRRAGEYPPGLEQDLAAHFQRLLSRRIQPPRPVDLRGPMAQVERALPLRADRIPVASQVPGGAALHKAVAKLVGRQTQGVLEQVQAFAEPVRQALDALTTAVEDLTREVREDLAAQVSAVLDRQAAQERAQALAAAGGEVPQPPVDGRRPFRPWYSSLRFEDEFRGSREDLLERYRDVAERLTGCAPVFDVGCGRGEFLELLGGLGIEAWGVDLDAELVKAASDRGLPVEQGDGLKQLERLDEASLGGLVLIQVVEHMSSQEVVDLVYLASTKVRPGGRVLIETVNPQSLYVLAHAFYLDPTHLRPVHPAYLMFLFKEAGFASVDIEWRSPPPEGDVMEEATDATEESSILNANARRLNELLFAPQDYLLVAVR